MKMEITEVELRFLCITSTPGVFRCVAASIDPSSIPIIVLMSRNESRNNFLTVYHYIGFGLIENKIRWFMPRFYDWIEIAAPEDTEELLQISDPLIKEIRNMKLHDITLCSLIKVHWNKYRRTGAVLADPSSMPVLRLNMDLCGLLCLSYSSEFSGFRWFYFDFEEQFWYESYAPYNAREILDMIEFDRIEGL
jgi:hypothetical protein